MSQNTAGVPGCVFPSQSAEKPKGLVIVGLDPNLVALAADAVDLDPNFFYVMAELQEEFALGWRQAKDQAYAALRLLEQRGNAKAAEALRRFHSISGS